MNLLAEKAAQHNVDKLVTRYRLDWDDFLKQELILYLATHLNADEIPIAVMRVIEKCDFLPRFEYFVECVRGPKGLRTDPYREVKGRELAKMLPGTNEVRPVDLTGQYPREWHVGRLKAKASLPGCESEQAIAKIIEEATMLGIASEQIYPNIQEVACGD